MRTRLFAGCAAPAKESVDETTNDATMNSVQAMVLADIEAPRSRSVLIPDAKVLMVIRRIGNKVVIGVSIRRRVHHRRSHLVALAFIVDGVEPRFPHAMVIANPAAEIVGDVLVGRLI